MVVAGVKNSIWPWHMAYHWKLDQLILFIVETPWRLQKHFERTWCFHYSTWLTDRLIHIFNISSNIVHLSVTQPFLPLLAQGHFLSFVLQLHHTHNPKDPKLVLMFSVDRIYLCCTIVNAIDTKYLIQFNPSIRRNTFLSSRTNDKTSGLNESKSMAAVIENFVVPTNTSPLFWIIIPGGAKNNVHKDWHSH